MVDHTFLFTGAVRKIKKLIDEGALGRLYYYDSTRVNLGLFQHDVNVIWDLAPHDFAIIDHLLGLEPEQVVATGQAHLNGHEDLAYITLYFPNDIIAHVNVNWLSPVKVRTTLIGGDRKMLVWNDLEPTEKIKVYDKGVEITGQQGIYDLLVSYRSGDMWAPRLEEGEALQREVRHFLDCIATGQRPVNDGRAGLACRPDPRSRPAVDRAPGSPDGPRIGRPARGRRRIVASCRRRTSAGRTRPSRPSRHEPRDRRAPRGNGRGLSSQAGSPVGGRVPAASPRPRAGQLRSARPSRASALRALGSPLRAPRPARLGFTGLRRLAARLDGPAMPWLRHARGRRHGLDRAALDPGRPAH